MNESVPRSPYDQLHGIVYIPRMLDKIRLHAARKLSEDYLPNLGNPEKMDGASLRFLGVDYEPLVALVASGATDEEVWEWSLQYGKKHSEEEILIWNAYMMKYGWRDGASEILQRRLQEGGYADSTDIQTIFDFLDLDEGREGRYAAVAFKS
ncbi:MAG: DUF5069 domain-containing protein [Chthoniobacterales bacterium]